MNSDFARNISLLRKERHISQKQAAADLGISQALLSHYEKGVRECGLNFLVKAADYYNVSCDYLLGRKSNADADDEEIGITPITIGNYINRLAEDAQNIGGKKLSEEILSCLMMTVYKLMRILHKNSRAFKIPKAAAVKYSDAFISVKEARIDETVMQITEIKISDPPSLESLIKLSEESILKIKDSIA